MKTSTDQPISVPPADPLELPLRAVEQQLAALGQALQSQDNAAVERAAAELHAALAVAVDHFSQAARRGGVPSALRHRLALASAQVAAQREALARATASLDRAIDVLMPRLGGNGAAMYSAIGGTDRSGPGGSLVA